MKIKVLHIMSFDWGGAAAAALRLHVGMLNSHIDSKVLLKWKSKYEVKNSSEFSYPREYFTFRKKIDNKYKQYKNIFFKQKSPEYYLRNAPTGFHLFTIPTDKYDITSHPLVKEADIIHLHWVADFIDHDTFFKKINKPIVWTLHDMNPFTGGCHYAMDCANYEAECFNCPQLYGTVNPNYSFYIQQKKIEGLSQKNNLHIVAPSKWLMECSLKSKVLNEFPHYFINYCINDSVFKRRDKQYSREILGLPQDKIILLFVAGDIDCKPKGYHLLKSSFAKIFPKENLLICAIGNNPTNNYDNNSFAELGPIADERLMSMAYSAADVFITPSLADNSPNTVIESLMCGTPVIGFPIGGIKDMIEHKINGLLCSNTDSKSLAETISYFLENSSLFDSNKISEKAKKKHYTNSIINEYKNLYSSVLII